MSGFNNITWYSAICSGCGNPFTSKIDDSK